MSNLEKKGLMVLFSLPLIVLAVIKSGNFDLGLTIGLVVYTLGGGLLMLGGEAE